MIRTPLALTIAATTLATLAPGVFGQSTKHSTAPQTKQPVRPAPIPEAADSWSATLRSQQAERRTMREMFEWSTLSPEAQEALWDDLVGPDQLNDGSGRARVRPSMQDQSGYDDRDGGFEDRDVPLVELSWVQTPALAATFDQFLGDSVLNVEGDVVLAGYRSDDRVRVMEIDGTRDSLSGGVTNWNRTFAVQRAFLNVDVDLFAAASGTLGDTYVSGVQAGRSNYPLITFNGVTGVETVGPEFPAGAVGGSPMVLDMAIDPEGMVYVVGTTPEAGGTRRWFVAKHDPRNGNAQEWITFIPGPAENTGGIKINRFGEIFITGSKRITSTNFDVFVARVSAYDGAIEWTMTDASPDLDEVADIELDATGTPHISGSVDVVGGGRAGKTIKVDRATGAVVWRRQITGYNYDLVVDEAGSVYVTGEGSTPSVARTTKYSSAGTQLWSVSRGTTADIPSIALDRLGNPYVAYRYGSGAALVEAVKYNPATGSVVWAYSVDAVASSQESNSNLRVRNVHVDAGGNVYITGNRSGTSSGGSGHALFCVRLEQPYVSIPQIARSTPNVRVEDHSVWLPHLEDIGSQGFNNTFRLFSIDVDQLANEPLIDDLLDIEVDYVLGTARGQVDVDLSNNVAIGVDFVTGATGGSYDATASGELEIVVPGEGELVAGQPFQVVIDFEPDPSGMEMIANSTPELSAAFKSNVTGTLDLDIRGYNRNLGGPYSTIFDVDVPTPTLSTLDNLTLFSILGPSLPAPGTWVNFDLPGVSGRLTMPRLLAEGAYSTSAPGGTNSGSSSDDDVMRLSSSLSETFCDLGVSVTDIITTTATGFPLSFGWGLPAGGSGTDASLGVGLLQAHLDGNMKVEQDLTLDMKPYVRFEFPDTSLSPITVDLVQRVQANGVTSFGPESPVTLTLPAGTGTMEIKPFFGIRAKMRNQSGFRFGASVGFDAFSVEATVSVLDVNIINREYCFGCTEQPIANARFNVFDYTSPEFNFTGDDPGDTEIELASIQVVGSTTTKPQLIGASRAAVPMIIYEQRTPTQAELTAAASGTEPMILYGRQFFGNTSQVNKAFIRHHGRTEELTTERLNDQALRVQVPRRFYLLPGIARIWTTNGNGRSETIDFPIEHPFPNFQGIAGLDGETNPVAWASDPRWSTEPVVAVDGGTPAGNDSFIARRDYYTQLRTVLWSPNLFPVGHASRNLTADAYFPAFKGWELPGARTQPPGFPTLIIDGVALGRHRPFINDGYFRSKPQASLFALPHVATLELINPGPGGGASRVRTVDIVAPPPVITHMEPATLAPDTDAIGGKVRVVVYGPDSVPYFPGYESLKAGNFTPESVVRFNGVDMPTTFVNSGQLTAEIPGDDVAVVGAHLVSVYTPSGGTSYTERLTTGGGSVGASTIVASGGVSVPITFTVAWPAPQIAAVSHDEITVDEVPYVSTPTDGSPSDGHNFGITGSNFAPGCTVFWNGRPLAATRLSAGAIRATVPASFIASPGAVQVIVVNPSPNRRASTPATVQIVP